MRVPAIPGAHVYRVRTQSVAIAAILLAALACGGGETTEPPPTPSVVIAVSANPVTPGQVATALPAQPAFEVRDAGGAALAGVAVSVAVTSGGGTLAGAPTVSLEGPTPIGAWTLGFIAGPQTVTVTVTGLTPLVFTVNATAGAPAALQVVAGNNQVGSPGTVVPGPIRVLVRDGFGNSVAGATVNWAVDVGGGNLAAATSVSDATGVATAPAWTLGGIAVDEQAIVASVGAATARFVVVQSAFFVDVRYVGTAPSATVQQAFTNAATRIRSIIVGDLTDGLANFAVPNFCVPTGQTPPLNEIIDDVLIFATVQPNDGPGGVLGSAGPCILRNGAGGLPAIGAMRFDSEDLADLAASGRLETVILHEMLHVIGVGTIWDLLSLQEGAGTASTRFTGPLAREACETVNGGAVPCAAHVPAENCLDLPIGQTCGGGTQDSHWKESIFRSELMTGFVGTGGSPLSAMTVQSLADMGYGVNVNRADAYTVPPTALRALLSAPADLMRLPAPIRPREQMDLMGRRFPIPPQ
jgi:hypothetical protein